MTTDRAAFVVLLCSAYVAIQPGHQRAALGLLVAGLVLLGLNGLGFALYLLRRDVRPGEGERG